MYHQLKAQKLKANSTALGGRRSYNAKSKLTETSFEVSVFTGGNYM